MSKKDIGPPVTPLPEWEEALPVPRAIPVELQDAERQLGQFLPLPLTGIGTTGLVLTLFIILWRRAIRRSSARRG